MKIFLTRIASSLCIFTLALGAAGCNGDKTDSALTLRFSALVEGQPLRLGAQRYASPKGSGEFTVEDFKVYISNVALRNSSNGDHYVEEDSYHLIRFGSETNTFDIVLEGTGANEYDSVEFGIGVDPERNLSIESRRDLNPNNQMAWNWDVGYKFVLLEGMFYPRDGGAPIPLVYHVGFSENYKELSFGLSENAERPNTRSTTVLTFNIEVMEMFRNPHAIEFSDLPSVKFDKADAKIFADNYADMIQLQDKFGLEAP